MEQTKPVEIPQTLYKAVEERAKDADFLSVSDFVTYAARKVLKSKGCVWKGQWIMIEGVPVDMFPADPLEEAVGQAQEAEYEGLRTKVVTPEYLIALFLRAGRIRT